MYADCDSAKEPWLCDTIGARVWDVVLFVTDVFFPVLTHFMRYGIAGYCSGLKIYVLGSKSNVSIF